jgi:hypothetical protein
MHATCPNVLAILNGARSDTLWRAALEVAAASLLALDRLEQRLEVALAKAE